MRDIDNLCMNCFNELTDGAVCTHCGYDNDTENEIFCLPTKTVIGDRYVIGALIKRESDAVSYMGYDPEEDKTVIIREFLPQNFANRLEGSKDIHVRQKYVDSFKKCKQSFYKLWKTLEKNQNLSAVVPVEEVISENGTIYAVISNIEAIPLRDYLLRNEKGHIQWENARIMLMPVLTTIEALHSDGIIHGSINPESLLLCGDGKVRLSPFTIAECCDANSELVFNCIDGYTALEQYDNKHKICPSTDIYAFCACIYRALVGSNPPDALSRESNDKLMIPNEIAELIPAHVIKALSQGLQVYPEKRVKDIATFRDELDASPVAQAKAADQIRKVDNEPEEAKDFNQEYEKYTRELDKKNKKDKSSKIAIVVLVILIIAAIGAGIYFIQSNNQQQQQTTTAAQTEIVEVPNFTNTGHTQGDVEGNAAWNKQFKITYEYEYSDSAEIGIICGQSIAAGEKVEAGTALTLTVSKGIQTEQVPDVGGMQLEDATKRLEEKGFKVSSVEVYNDGSHVENQVKSLYASAPSAGENVAVGSEIILQVYGVAHTTTTEATTEQEIAPMD